MSYKRVFALLTPEKPQLVKWLKMLQKAVFALLGCQQMGVTTLLCDTLGLAEYSSSLLFALLAFVCIYHSFQNHYMFNLKTIKSCNCVC